MPTLPASLPRSTTPTPPTIPTATAPGEAFALLATPLGHMRFRASPRGLTHALFVDESPVITTGRPGDAQHTPACEAAAAHVRGAAEQVAAYFAGTRREFTLALAPMGTPFQHTVWDALLTIPYGTTCSYGELARRLGDPGASRAVGLANARNPLAILVPCHRVLNAAGGVHGYAGGVWRKSFLLELEQGRAGLFAV